MTFKEYKRSITFLIVIFLYMTNSILEGQIPSIERLDNSINSPEKSELRPLVSLDGSVLFFSRSIVYPNNKGEVWQSFFQPDLSWGGCLNPGAPLNGYDVYYTLAAIADNGKKLYLYDNLGGAAIVTRQKMSYTLPQALKFVSAAPSIIDYTLAADGKTMVLASKQKKGSDLFVSFRRADGTFSDPLSLGKQLNTPHNEQGAFLCSNLHTLYFASNGREGLGGLDIYKTERLDDTWQNWSEPVNIGSPINDVQDQTFLSISETDGWAYFAKADDDATTDIWRAKIPTEPIAQPSLAQTKISAPLAATSSVPAPSPQVSRRDTVIKAVYITKRDTVIRKEIVVKRDTIFQSKTIVKHDTLKISLPLVEKPRKHDTIYIEKYIPIDTAALLAAIKEKAEIKPNSTSTPIADNKLSPMPTVSGIQDLEANTSLIKKGQIIPLGIQFDINESKIKRDYLPEMQRVLDFLRVHSNLVIEISGHTSGLADDGFALRLSTERAKVMRDWLCNHGISENHVEYKGYGKSRPIYNNDTPKGRQGNQRLEVLIIDILY